MVAIRWLRRPRPVRHVYVCDRCSVVHVNYVDPDLITVGPLHTCKYKDAKGSPQKRVRELHLQ